MADPRTVRSTELVIALQRAFYIDGLSLSDPAPATYQKIAVQAGLDADAAELGVSGSPPSWQWTAHASSPWSAATPPPMPSTGAWPPSPDPPPPPARSTDDEHFVLHGPRSGLPGRQ